MLTVKQRQLNLKTYYFLYKDKIDGIEGNNTKEAYKKFQEKVGIKVDGIYGYNTNLNLLNVTKDIQQKLNNNGYNLVIDGIIGNNTINAIKDFQKKNNLVVDGIVGNNTYNLLSKNPWDNIKHFKKSEFTCKCGCGLNNIDINLVYILEKIRNNFNKPVIITSGCRCKKYNAFVGGVSNSKHLYGKAADFVVSGIPTYQVLNYCYKLKKQGIINYTYGQTSSMGNAVHIDIN